MNEEYDIIVIGAGAAGLMAASELCVAGKRVLVVEARKRLGGRIHSVQNGQTIIETGAEFVHGDLPITLGLLKEGSIGYHPISGEMQQIKNGKWVEEEHGVQGWDRLMKEMGKLKKDIVFSDFLQLHFKGEEFNTLKNSATGFAQGFDLADISKASTMELYEEWKNEDHEQYRIDGGYTRLVDYLSEKCIKNGCKIVTGHVISDVHWQKNKVTVITSDKKEFTSQKLIVTIPLPLLQQQTILFDPALPESIKAFQQIGSGSVIKILLEFKNAFWDSGTKQPGFIISDQPIPTWWTQAPEQSNILTGWLGGPPAEKLYHETNDNIIHLAIQSLSAIFNITPGFIQDQLSDAKVFNWDKDPFARGAYSYALPETKEARKFLSEPVEDTLYFAGEALHEGDSPGTVEAALASGRDVAGKIL
jgi:monoamine oxidase